MVEIVICYGDFFLYGIESTGMSKFFKVILFEVLFELDGLRILLILVILVECSYIVIVCRLDFMVEDLIENVK